MTERNEQRTALVTGAGGGMGREIARQLIARGVRVAIADIMFDLPAFTFSRHARHGSSQLLSEFVATFGLLVVIQGCSRRRPSTLVAIAVAAYVTAAYWFTASTSFANPAVTIARSLSDTFAGIRPQDAPLFVVAQLLGAAAATGLFRWLIAAPAERSSAEPTFPEQIRP